MAILARVAATGTRRRPPKLLIELVVIAALMAGAAIGIYYGFRSPPVHDVLPLGGRNVDVSRSTAAQFEASVAFDPAHPRRVFAASMDSLDDARLYSSADGGATWTTRGAPPFERGACGLSHPTVAAAGDAEAVASTATDSCQSPDPLLYVAVRRGSRAWVVRRVDVTHRYVYDGRPSVAADASGNVYVAWPQFVGEVSSRQRLLFSRSTDFGATWSPPRRIGTDSGVYGVDLVAAGRNELYLAVSNGAGGGVDVLRSTDGGATWRTKLRVARYRTPYAVGCGAGAASVASQPQRCASAIARIAVSPRRIAVAYSDASRAATQGVYVVTTDRSLLSASKPTRVGPHGNRTTDQFLPTIAYDASTGVLWTCYYDTFGDPARKHAWYTCALSRDGGRRWSRPVHAASSASDEAQTAAGDVGYGDAEGLYATSGVAHPFWTDSRNILKQGEEIYTAAIPERQPAAR